MDSRTEQPGFDSGPGVPLTPLSLRTPAHLSFIRLKMLIKHVVTT